MWYLGTMPPNDTPPTDGPLLAERYRLGEALRPSPYSATYRAWDERLRVWRVAKVLLPEWAEREGVRERFEHCAQVMALKPHPHVVKVVESGSSDGLPYLVMEWTAGGTLMHWLQRHGRYASRGTLARQEDHFWQRSVEKLGKGVAAPGLRPSWQFKVACCRCP